MDVVIELRWPNVNGESCIIVYGRTEAEAAEKAERVLQIAGEVLPLASIGR